MVWELIHRLVELLNRTFENVSELDIMINSGLVRMPVLPLANRLQRRSQACVARVFGKSRKPAHHLASNLPINEAHTTGPSTLAGAPGFGRGAGQRLRDGRESECHRTAGQVAGAGDTQLQRQALMALPNRDDAL